MASLAGAAATYSELGWVLVPLEGKMPIGHGWQNSLPLPPAEASMIWTDREGKNMGLVLGPSGVIDFELDGGDPELYWSLVGGDLPKTPAYLSGTGKPHILFRDPGGLSRRSRDGFELRAGPHQSVIPPSIHPDTGRPYEWKTDPRTPLADPPQALLDFFAQGGSKRETDSHWSTPLRKGKLGEGEGRHASLVSFLGKVKNVFDDPDQFVQAAISYCAVAHDPPYPDEVIERQALDIWHRYREEPTIQEAEQYLNIVTADKIEMRSVEFLWRPFLQRSAFHLLVGRKGAGKGSVLAWLAAQMTNGFGGVQEPRSVLWIATEDSFEIDVKPRFVVQGGQEEMLLAVRQSVLLPRDLPAMEAVCREWGVGMVVVDPIVGVIGSANTNDEGPIVAAIGGLNQLADELDLSVIGVRHIGKNIDGGILEAVLGSSAWVNTPRAVLGIAQDEDTKVVTMEILAGNRVRGKQSYDFDLKEAKVKGVDEPVTKVEPKGDSNSSIHEVIRRRNNDPKVPKVKKWLLGLMEDSTPLTTEGVAEECVEKFGVGVSVIRKAQAELKEEGKLRWIPPAKGENGQFVEGTRWYFQKT